MNALGSGRKLPQVQKQLQARRGPGRHLECLGIVNVQTDELLKTKISTINFSKYRDILKILFTFLKLICLFFFLK